MTASSERFLNLVAQAQYPARSLDHEWGVPPALTGDALPADTLRCGFCYPASYELGQSNNAIQILYGLANKLPGVAAERVFLPGDDLRALMREAGAPLVTLETHTAVRDLDVLGITLPYELSFPAVLEVLDLAGLPLHAAKRDSSMPLVIGGGPSVYNPEPLAPFFDAFFLGEAEETLGALCALLRTLQAAGASREEQLRALLDIDGMYIPSFYESVATDSGWRVTPRSGTGAPPVVHRAVAREFVDGPVVPCLIVPYAEVVHDRLTVEVQRGCTRGCRFCQAGMTYRPVRERRPDDLVREVLAGLTATGYDEVSLTSLSTTDYSHLPEVLRRLKSRLEHTGVALSLPSLRIDAFSVEAARLVSGGAKKSGLTFAPEAGSQRLRDVINKNVTEEQLIDTIRVTAASGWRRVKLYFMIGLPTETDEDVRAIAALVERVQEMLSNEFDRGVARGFKISVSVASFVPKAHTPFQWEAQDTRAELKRKQRLLREAMPRRGVILNFHGTDTSFVEGVLARGDRRVAGALEAAWRTGAATDAWEGDFDPVRWEQAFASVGIDGEEIACRARNFSDDLCWAHLSTGVAPAYLRREAEAARREQTTPDCSFGQCGACGACQAAGIDPATVAGRRRENAAVAAGDGAAENAGEAAGSNGAGGGEDR